MKRVLLPILVLLLAALSADALPLAASVRPATHPGGLKPVAVGPLLQPFVATGLPTGRTIGMPLHQRFPAGFTLKHKHPGNRYVFILSGTVQISDVRGSKTYHAGMFFWEPAWQVHTLNVL